MHPGDMLSADRLTYLSPSNIDPTIPPGLVYRYLRSTPSTRPWMATCAAGM